LGRITTAVFENGLHHLLFLFFFSNKKIRLNLGPACYVVKHERKKGEHLTIF